MLTELVPDVHFTIELDTKLLIMFIVAFQKAKMGVAVPQALRPFLKSEVVCEDADVSGKQAMVLKSHKNVFTSLITLVVSTPSCTFLTLLSLVIETVSF